MNVSSPFDPNSLPPDTRMHFRAVAQNSGGTFYGGDRILSKGNPAPEAAEDTTKYRTATYRDWADAKDEKGKRKAIKCKPDKVDFCFSVVTDSPRTGAIEVTFSQPVDVNSFSITPAFGSGGTLDLAGKKWAWGWVGSINDPGLDAGGDCHYLW